MRSDVLVAAGAVAAEVAAQAIDANGCLRLVGSVACPGFASSYINPSNLSNAFPWMDTVTDVTSFDIAALNYFTDPYEWQATKFERELGCTNASTAVIRWERTVLCSQWVNERWSVQCGQYYNTSTTTSSPKMICQSTCLEYSASEYAVVNSTTYCPGPDTTNGNRTYNLNKDFVDCTNWTTLATNNSATCVSGSSNEGNCGFGASTTQLCGFCSGSNPDDCCYSAITDATICGFTLSPKANATTSSSSALPSSTSSIAPSSTASGSLQGNSGSSSNSFLSLSGGQIAGIVVGCVLGGLLLGALLALLVWCCCFRKRRKDRTQVRDSMSSFAPSAAVGAGAGAGAGGLWKSGRNGHNNSSEKGLLGSHGPAGLSSPSMGGGTMYSGGMNRSRESPYPGAMNKSMDSAVLSATTPLSPSGAMFGSTPGSGSGGAGAAGAAGAAGGGAGGGSGAGAGAAAGAAGAAAGLGLTGATAGGFAGGTGNRHSGVVLPRVRDENQTAERWIETGSEVSVLWPYQAALPDELDLRPGMRLRVLRLYDDAWGTAQVVGGEAAEMGRQGAFPIVCVSEGSTLGASSPGSAASHGM
ncbi:hypothetical protein JCM24511_08881 [Saitozyma sp. JCM 24511]|nr:hypothetical protein JCM24511_08881 [Saitozyma sp. JCM 24511]